MIAESWINLAYIVAAILFVFGIKMLGSVETARRGNRLSALGMLIAVVVTLLDQQIVSYGWVVAALVVGGLIGGVAARWVKMTAMPEMVALFNGFGGMASLLVGWAEYEKWRYWQSEGMEAMLGVDGGPGVFTATAVALAVLIGGVTFTGSLYAYAKLAGKVSGRPCLFCGQRALNGFAGVMAVVVLVAFVVMQHAPIAQGFLIVGVVLVMILGILIVMPIGGGDMPVVIALLNSLSGLAASAAGFVISNNVLIVAGCLVGASGLILTVIMCKAMNRTLGNVLFSGFGAASGNAAAAGGEGGELKPITAEDAFYVLEAASQVVIIPGYGMAVAQAQHAVKELGELLENNGCEVRYVIHPVAGRMPGHMNVLLAEADVPYEQLVEMDAANPTMDLVDVAVVIGANDVVNPAAADDASSPIYGMPIIEAHRARTVFVLKRGAGAGFSGLENALFTRPNTRMLYGDAKASITTLVTQFKG